MARQPFRAKMRRLWSGRDRNVVLFVAAIGDLNSHEFCEYKHQL
jgi:hypothetical protein